MMTLLIVLLVLVCLGGLPGITPHGYGYGPSAIIGLIIIIVLVLMFAGWA